MAYLPKFQAQNPEISHYTLGWSSCTAFTGAMQVDAATMGLKKPTGAQIRGYTGDTVGGLTLAQADQSEQHYGIDIDVRYRYPFADFVKRVNAGEPAHLQGGYAAFADMHGGHFDAGNGFRRNHDILVCQGMIALDPLADGRYPNVYKYHGEAYPQDMLERFAGLLNLEPRPSQPARYLGQGLVYAAFAPKATAWHATVRPGGTSFIKYEVVPRTDIPLPHLQIRGRSTKVTKSGFQLRCTRPVMIWERPADDGIPTTKRSLVQISEGSYAGWWIDSKWASQI